MFSHLLLLILTIWRWLCLLISCILKVLIVPQKKNYTMTCLLLRRVHFGYVLQVSIIIVLQKSNLKVMLHPLSKTFTMSWFKFLSFVWFCGNVTFQYHLTKKSWNMHFKVCWSVNLNLNLLPESYSSKHTSKEVWLVLATNFIDCIARTETENLCSDLLKSLQKALKPPLSL